MKTIKIKMFGPILWLILPKRFIGITLWPFGIYFRSPVNTKEVAKRHEYIHWQQQKEMLGIGFYLWYFIEWIIKLFIYGSRAYQNISFEREAYGNEKNVNYVHPRFGWFKYIKQ